MAPDPANVVSLFPDGGACCRLCDSYFTGSPAEHVTKHETSLRTWREQQGRNGKVSDSDITEKLDRAVLLLGEGLSQRQAAAIAGISRSNLQRRLLPGDPERSFELHPNFVENSDMTLWGRMDFFRAWHVILTEASQQFSLMKIG